jgi:Flp pilus assembly protein TadD
MLPLAVAVSACTDRAALDSSAGQLSLHVADAALVAGAPDLALHVAESILAPHPRDLDALATKGDALYMEAQYDPAEQAYRAILAIDPGSVRGQIGLGRILLRTDPSAAEVACLRALQRDPRNVAALSNLGVAHDLQGRPAEAQLAYRQALDIAPNDTATLTSLGLSLALSGDAGAGVRILRPLARDPAASSRLRNDLAVALTLAGDRTGAERILNSDLSQPETANAIDGYLALAMPGQAAVILAQNSIIPTYTEPTASAPEPDPVAPFAIAAVPPPKGLRPRQPLVPITEQSEPSAAASPAVSPPARPLPRAIESSTEVPQSQAPQIAAIRPDATAPPIAIDATPTTTAVKSPGLVAPSIMDLAILLHAIEAGRSAATTETAPALPAAPMSGWLAAVGVDITMPFAAIESNVPADGAMLAVALPTDLPATEVWSWLGEGWPLAIAQLPSPAALPALAAVQPAAQMPPAGKPLADRGSSVPRQQPYAQVAALASQQQADSEWEQLRARAPELMSGRSPTVLQAEVHGRMFWRLRTSGFTTLAEANEFCGRIQAAGSGCWTMLAVPPP